MELTLASRIAGGGASTITVDFSVDDTTPEVGQTVTFTNLTTGGANQWHWDFGDGTFSTLQNPTHVYSIVGTQTVTLLAGKTGGGGVESKSNYIDVQGDPDVAAFVSATGLSDTTTIDAMEVFIPGLKNAGIYTALEALYLIVGTTAALQKWNFMDPQDTDAAFRLTFTGGWVHSATGMKANGTNCDAATHLVPSTHLPSDNYSFFSYRDDYTTGIAMSAEGANSGRAYDWSASNLLTINNTSGVAVTGGLNQMVVCTRDSSTTLKYVKNGTTTSGIASTSNGRSNGQFRIGSFNGTAFWADAEFRLAGICNRALTDTEAADLTTLNLAFQTALSRQV